MESRNQDGFSLVEIMVTTALVGMIMVGALGTQREGLHLGNHGESVTADTLLAGSMAEILRLHAAELPERSMPLLVPANSSGNSGNGVEAELQRLLTSHRNPEATTWISVQCSGPINPVCQACRGQEPTVCSQPVML